MFEVQTFHEFGGWTPVHNARYDNRKDAINRAQLYRIEAHRPGQPNAIRPVRVIELIVHKEWASDAPVEI